MQGVLLDPHSLRTGRIEPNHAPATNVSNIGVSQRKTRLMWNTMDTPVAIGKAQSEPALRLKTQVSNRSIVRRHRCQALGVSSGLTAAVSIGIHDQD